MTKDEIQKRLQEIIRKSPVRGRIRKVSLFGSYLHGDAGKNSDVDLLLEYTTPISLLDMAGLEIDLSKGIGKKVDLQTPGFLSRYFRDNVLAEAEPLYESR